MRKWIFTLAFFSFTSPSLAGWKAGVAVRKITPAAPMWMAGYAARTKPADGTDHELFVKALALEDPSGGRVVLLTSDLIGIPRSLSEAVAADVKAKCGLPRERLMLTASHTHCGPVVRDNLADMYPMPPDEAKKIGPYSEKLRGWMVEAVVEALGKLKPARLAFGGGTARFAVNRRTNVEKTLAEPLRGPVDHSVPVLRVTSEKDELVAVAFGYACHNTTMDYLKWSGDYAGFAQAAIEAKHKGAVALFWAGCGGDQNPLPRRKLSLCQDYGRQLADAVEGVLAGKMTPLTGALRPRYAEFELPYGALPTREQVAADMLSKTLAVRARAARLKKRLDDGGAIDKSYPHYPIQAWKLGDQVTWVALGGEVVVDYSLRLKKELGGTVWVTAYANDVMAYIPSERVLKEGGYEGEGAMVYYGLPAKWAAGVEGKIVGRVQALAKE